MDMDDDWCLGGPSDCKESGFDGAGLQQVAPLARQKVATWGLRASQEVELKQTV